MFKIHDDVRVRGYSGIAFYIYDIDEDNDQATVIMVGDDRRYVVDIDDLTPLNEDEFCGTCGQIGCGHGRG